MEWIVPPDCHGEKLVSFLKRQTGEQYSSRLLKRAIEGNLCKVNGRVERFASLNLKSGQRVNLRESAIEDLSPSLFRREKSRILYEDDDLFVYNKPVGITSDETGLAALLSNTIAVHRLDRETTGVIIFAKNALAEENLLKQFHDRLIHKEYLALVDGVPTDPRGYIENYIGRAAKVGDNTIWGIVKSSNGRLAQTSWEVIRRGSGVSLIRCQPRTGRTHQIRLHMVSIGHPILGDYRYCKTFKSRYHATRCLLHAYKLTLTHPTTGKLLTITAPIPSDMEKAMKELSL